MPVSQASEGPHVAAFLCEKVLEEKDGTKTAVRIIDRLTRSAPGPDAPPTMEPFDYEMALLIKLVSGHARGTYLIGVNLFKPSGESKKIIQYPVNFEGDDDRGAHIIVALKFRVEMAGLYWFEIVIEDHKGDGNSREELLTRVPFRVVYLPRANRPQR